MKALAKHLIGRKIVAIDFRPFPARPGNDRSMAHDPIITLDNGRKLFFMAEETEVGEYGTCLLVSDSDRGRLNGNTKAR